MLLDPRRGPVPPQRCLDWVAGNWDSRSVQSSRCSWIQSFRFRTAYLSGSLVDKIVSTVNERSFRTQRNSTRPPGSLSSPAGSRCRPCPESGRIRMPSTQWCVARRWLPFLLRARPLARGWINRQSQMAVAVSFVVRVAGRVLHWSALDSCQDSPPGGTRSLPEICTRIAACSPVIQPGGSG